PTGSISRATILTSTAPAPPPDLRSLPTRRSSDLGSEPGPACYGRGGSEATVTDADVVLGRIDPATFSGGRMPLDVSAARTAVAGDRKSTRLNSSHVKSSYAVFCLKKKTRNWLTFA